MIRSFIAISIPADILQRIDSTIDQLRNLGLKARYPTANSIHLTLKFLGDLETSVVADVSRALDAAVQSSGTFELTISGAGVFPNLRRPRIVWIGVEASSALQELKGQVEDSLMQLGFEREQRAFYPHLTVARLKAGRNLSKLRNFLEMEGPELSLGSFEVSGIQLMQSILRPEGAEYRRLSNHPLKSR